MNRSVRLWAAVLGCQMLIAPLEAYAADQTRLLEVIVNGYSTNKIGEFVLRDGALFAKPGELLDLGLRIDDTMPRTADGLIALSSLPGVSSTLDEAAQNLNVHADSRALIPAQLKAENDDGHADSVEYGTGTTMNYDANATLVGGKAVGTGAFSFRGYSPLGLLTTNLLAFVRTPGKELSGSGVVRLNSTYVYSDPDHLRRLYAGDLVTDGVNWSRPVSLGGIKFASDFSLQPHLISFPEPDLAGTAVTPSTVDVLVNGTPVLSQPVQPGPFEIPHVPVPAGTNSVAMRLTNAAGQLALSTTPYYASTTLLADGLQSYSVEFGKLRQNYGVSSNDYGNAALSATYRRGLSSGFTFETHGEATPGTFMGGIGGIATLAEFCVVNAAVAASGGHTGGSQFSFGAEHVDSFFSTGASAAFSTRGFGDLASTMDNPVPARTINFNASASLDAYGSLGLIYSIVDFNTRPLALRFSAPADSFTPVSALEPGGEAAIANGIASFQPAQRAHILSANYSMRIGEKTLSATAFHDFAGGGEGAAIGLAIPLGERGSAAAETGSGSNGGYGVVQAQDSPAQIDDWGYRVSATAGRQSEEDGQASYQARWALVSAGADRFQNKTSLNADVQGAVSYVDGTVAASNTIPDAFAIVDADGVANVSVMNENNTIGKTDASGHLIVTDLRSFDTNHIAINPTDVPLDANVESTEAEVKPADHAGVIVHFHIKVSHGAVVKLVDRANAPLPVGSAATLKSSGKTVSVGYDGEAFVEDLAAEGNELTVERPNGRRCTARFASRSVPGEIPTIGPVTCVEETS